MNKQLLAIVGAVALALLGFLALISYARGADDRAFEGTELVTVLRVTAEVPVKTPASELGDSVETVDLPKAAVVEGAIDDLSEIDGLVTRGVLVPGDQLTAAKFDDTNKVKADTNLPKGMQELTVPLENPRIVGGTLVPGDKVGVMTSYTDGQDSVTANPINDLLVIRVNGGVGAAEGEAVSVMVTFAIKTLDAEKVVHAMEFGKVWLTKQNDDTDTGGGRTITKEDVAP